jgi:hypothetical protein
MKKFSNITGQKVAEEPKIEKKITESDIFKSKVMSLLDDLLRVQMYGPITRYHVAGTMKVAGKELFVEALMDLLDSKSNKEKVKLLESLKSKITDWKVLDEKIESINSQPEGLYRHKKIVKSLYSKYSEDADLLIEQTEKSADKINTVGNAFLRLKACESLLADTEYNHELISKMAEKYKKRVEELTENF